MDAVRQERILEAKRWELAKEIAVAWYELGKAAESIRINDRLNAIVDQVLRIAEVKYSTGTGLQQDIFSAQVKQTELIDERIELEKRRRTVQARINALLNSERAMEIDPPGKIVAPGLDLDAKALEARAVRDNPWTEVRLTEVRQAEVRRELAVKDYYPDMDYKISYGQRDPDELGNERADFLSAQVTFSIPLWKKNKQDRRLAAAEKAKSAAVKSYESLVQTLPHQVQGIVAEIEETERALELVDKALMVQTSQWAESSMTAYEVGKLEFDTMIESNTRLLRLELKSLGYRTALNVKRAELEQLLGGRVAPESDQERPNAKEMTE
jgi:outer membrane protein TolC